MPDAPGLELIAQEINAVRPGTVTETAFDHGRATLIVDPEGVIDALSWLRDTRGQRYTFLSSLHGADYLPATPRFAVHYELLCRERVERIHVKALLADPAGLPEIDSCVEMFPTAEFQEREVYDFFGVIFRGHPDLRRILMPEDYVGWPQRRDFPVGGEPVLFTYNEVEMPRWYE
ncbi:MAG: NADH-quinone oxidoreductase subunit C [Actinomycetota bacterium]|nr:NADH-quinone oxidoreductase subunit C [Actinomycetota bacterium]